MEWAALCFCLCFCPSLYIRMLGNKVKGGDWNEGTSPMLQWWGLYWSRVGCCYGGDRCHLVLGRGLRAKLRESEERDWQRKKKSGWGVIEKRLKCADMCHLWLLSQLVPCWNPFKEGFLKLQPENNRSAIDLKYTSAAVATAQLLLCGTALPPPPFLATVHFISLDNWMKWIISFGRQAGFCFCFCKSLTMYSPRIENTTCKIQMPWKKQYIKKLKQQHLLQPCFLGSGRCLC